MITCIRDVRRARGMTLDDVARACRPPTTAQTIGRLETGTRTVSLGWLERIAAALEVTAADLVRLPDQASLAVAALLDGRAARAPVRAETAAPPAPSPEMVAVRVVESVGEYRAGDVLWCERLTPEAFAGALNRDVLVPGAAGRFLFGRLIAIEGEGLTILPAFAGGRPTRVEQAAWIAVTSRLVRTL